MIHLEMQRFCTGDLLTGVTFGSTINLSNSTGGSFLPVISASGNNVHVVWSDSTLGNVNEIFYRRSTNNGASFGSTINIYILRERAVKIFR
jgi:hypothetical protein